MEVEQIILKLAQARTTRDVSAYELSLRIDKSPNYIYRLEDGAIGLSMKIFLQICHALEINPRDIFI